MKWSSCVKRLWSSSIFVGVVKLQYWNYLFIFLNSWVIKTKYMWNIKYITHIKPCLRRIYRNSFHKNLLSVIIYSPSLFRTGMTFFLLWNIKEDILKNVSTVFLIHTVKVTGVQNNTPLFIYLIISINKQAYCSMLVHVTVFIYLC